MKRNIKLLTALLLVVACACTTTEDVEPVFDTIQDVEIQDLLWETIDRDTTSGSCTQCPPNL